MSLLNFLKPKWQHSDPGVRLAAINSSECPNQEELAELIVTETDLDVCKAAISKLDDCSLLTRLLSKVPSDASYREEIKLRIDSLKIEAVLNAQELSEKEQALQAISDDHLLCEIAVRENLLEIRLLAAQRIEQEDVLIELLTANCGKQVSISVVERITNPESLEIVSQKASNRAARTIATKKLDKLSEDKAAAQKEFLDQHTSEILERIKVLPMLSDIEGAYQQSQEITEEWKALAVPKTHPSYDQFNDYAKQVKDRYTTYLNQTEEERQKLAKLPTLLESLNSLENQILSEAENLDTAQALQTFIQLKSQWEQTAEELDEVPKQSLKRFKQNCRQFEEKQLTIQQELQECETYTNALQTLKSKLSADTLNDCRNELSELNKQLKQWKPHFVSKNEAEQLAADASGQVSTLQSQIEQETKQRIDENITARKDVIASIKELIGHENIQLAEKQFEELKNGWKTKDDLPLDELKELNQQFSSVCEEFAQYRKQSYENNDWQYWQNKNLKTDLIEEMNLLGQENDLHQVYKKMKDLQSKWKEIGPVKHKDSEKLWKKFQEASEQNFERCKQFFNELDRQAEINAGLKIALIEQAQALQESTQWKKTADELIELQKQWKKIGRAPQDKENELFADFRKACDQFFIRRQAHYDELDAQRKENLDKKEELCEKLEKLVAKPDLSKKEKVAELQKEWKRIGRVPKESEDEIWQRFRAASEVFYTWLDTLKPDNLEQKEKLCLAVEGLCENLPDFSDEKKVQELSGQIIELQNQWKKIGPVPDENKDEIWQRFRGPCDDFFSKRKQHHDAIDKKRPENEKLKRVLLEKLEESIGQNNKGSVKEIIKLQDEWKKIGPASKKNDFHLDRKFKETCNGFFKERREVYEEMDAIRRENLKQKEALCVRMEILAGIDVPKLKSTGKKKNSLTLAEQLQLAFEENFVLAGDDKDKSRRKKDELAGILEEWKQIGPVPKEHEFSLKKRYKKALGKLQAGK